MAKNERIALFLLILVKVLISIPFIQTNPIDLDEPFSIFHAQKNLPELFQVFNKENNPPLHFLLLHYWENLFGIGPIAVRSLSLLFSVLTIPILWSIGKILIDKKGAFILCTLFIFSDFHHYYGLEARTYSLLIFQYALLILFLTRILFLKSKNISDFVLLGLVNALLFYTHYIFPFIAFSEFILFIVFFKTIELKKVLVSLVLFIALILPWSSVMLNRTENLSKTGTWLNQAQYSELYGFINKFLNDKWAFLALIIVVLIVIFVQFNLVKEEVKNGRQVLFFLGILFFVPYLSTFFLSKQLDISLFYDRYLFFLTIPLFLFIAWFFSRNKQIGLFAFSFFIGVYLLRFDLQPNNERNGDKLADYVRSTAIKTIFIAPEYYDLTFVYHYNRELFKQTDLRNIERENGLYPFDDKVSYQGVTKGCQEIIVVDADFSFTQPHSHLYTQFQRDFNTVSERTFKGNYRVTVFRKKSQL